jgi:hypothetical protein
MVEIKAAQMGLTTKAMLKAMYGARYRNFRGILYLFPSRTDVTEFAKGRIDPLIEDNPDTLGRWLQETDSANIKQVWNCFLYLRGMKSRVGLKSIPVDFLVFDEMDEASPAAVDMAMERMSHSDFREVLKLSNPTLPDYGIDKAFQETDQRFWHVKCLKCGEYTCLEESFPKCLIEAGGRVIRACRKCEAELNPSIGEWVAKRPGVIDKRGYHYSQLFSHYVDPAEILHQFRTTNNLTEFYNLKLGMAYVEATNRLTVQEVLALCGNEGIASSDPGPCSMGVDQGKFLHVVIGKREWQRAGKIVHAGEYLAWEELDRLMKVFNVSRCVVDALPETRNARAFAEKHKGKVFLSYYSEHRPPPKGCIESGFRPSDQGLPSAHTPRANQVRKLSAPGCALFCCGRSGLLPIHSSDGRHQTGQGGNGIRSVRVGRDNRFQCIANYPGSSIKSGRPLVRRSPENISKIGLSGLLKTQSIIILLFLMLPFTNAAETTVALQPALR